ncbi:hypothetical protein HMPREF9374_1537 [Desmospora sp. 8437]|nr:hypothetical protein HMPREF9374_1537 [Desmospora sp. 8437]
MQKYDATYQIGGTTIHVVAPNITDEERRRRLEGIKRIIRRIWIELHQE